MNIIAVNQNDPGMEFLGFKSKITLKTLYKPLD
jgi:hypothetical protein